MPSKTVLITGCSASGIGSALASAFQAHNYHVFATARNPTKMSHLAHTPNMTLLTLDPTSAPSVEAAIRTVTAVTGGTLDVLVNNAGYTFSMPVLDVDVDAAKDMFEINVWGALRVTQAFAPLVIKARGTVVNVSSVAASLHTPWIAMYAGSKAALTAITDTLRLEVAPFGVRVLMVQTGAVRTNTLAAGVDFALPAGSRYKDVEKEIGARARGEDGVTRMAPGVFAEKVVGDVVGGVNGTVWRGGLASVVRFVAGWLPVSVSDWMSVKGTGLDVMKV